MANKNFSSDDDTPATATLSIADLIAALKASSGNDDESMRKRARFEAEARKLLEEDENRTHPGISAYSYPEGDRAAAAAGKVKQLKCQMFWVGYPLDVDNLTPTEVDLLNAASGGVYHYTKSDGSRETLTVKPSFGHNGALDKLEFTFPCRGDLRHNQPGMVALLREALGIGGPTQDALLAELAKLQAKVAAYETHP